MEERIRIKVLKNKFVKNICQGAQVVNFPKMDLDFKDTRMLTI